VFGFLRLLDPLRPTAPRLDYVAALLSFRRKLRVFVPAIAGWPGSFLDNINIAFIIASAVKIVFSLSCDPAHGRLLRLCGAPFQRHHSGSRGSEPHRHPAHPLRFKKDLPFSGLLQPMADWPQFILKEDFTRARQDLLLLARPLPDHGARAAHRRRGALR